MVACFINKYMLFHISDDANPTYLFFALSFLNPSKLLAEIKGKFSIQDPMSYFIFPPNL